MSFQPIVEQLIQKLQRSWALGLSPNWEAFVDAPDVQNRNELAIKICSIDLNWRLELEAAGHDVLPIHSIVNDLYWPRLREVLSIEEACSLAALEYQLRWHCGLPTSAEDFAQTLHPLICPPSFECPWNCPSAQCEADNDDFNDCESQQSCKSCGELWENSQIFKKAIRWHPSNAPNWLLRQLAEEPQRVGVPGTYGAAIAINDDDTHNQRTVLKVLHPRWTDNPEIDERFMRESLILALMDGQGTPFLHRAGRLPDGRYYFQMQLIAGKELRECVETLDPLYLIDRFEEVVHAVAVAHDLGIIHRDLSPRNVVVDQRRNRAVVLDWGQGRIDSENVDESASTFDKRSIEIPSEGTAISCGLGSPGFQAPELGLDATRATRASDVFSLGSLLIYCLTRGSVVAGNSATSAYEARYDTLKDTGFENAILALSRLRQTPPLSAEVELLDLCTDCIQLAPSQRPASAVIVAERMQLWKAERQKRLEVIPIVKARNRLAWSLLGVLATATLSIIALTVEWQKRSREALQSERALGMIRETARIQANTFALSQERLASEKTKEAANARAFSSLLIDVFKSTDPLALEGAGYRDTAETVQQMTSVELLKRVARSINEKNFQTREAREMALDGIGDALRGLGEANRAEELLREAESLITSTADIGNTANRVLLHFHLALLYHDMREFEVAEQYYLEVLKSTAVENMEPSFRNQVEFRYAWLLAEDQREHQARDLFQKVKQDRQQALGNDHSETQAADIALLLMSMKSSDPNTLLQRVQQLAFSNSKIIELVKSYIPVHVLRNAGLNAQAASAYEALLLRAEKILPAQHPILGMLIGDMAGFYRKIGNKTRAMQLAERALVIARHTIPTHPLSLELYRELGKEYEADGKLIEAKAIYLEALKYLNSRKSPSLAEARQKIEAALKQTEFLINENSSKP